MLFSAGAAVAVKMASTSRLVCPPGPLAEGRAGRAGRSPGRQDVPEVPGLAGCPGQRHLRAAGLSGVSQGVPSCPCYRPSVLGRFLTQAPPCGGRCVSSPWPRIFCRDFNRLFFSCYLFSYACFSIYGPISPRVCESSFQRAGNGSRALSILTA